MHFNKYHYCFELCFPKNNKLILIEMSLLCVQVAEYFVGDGPSNRYALVCRQCAGHNGMALAEEFMFIGNFA